MRRHPLQAPVTPMSVTIEPVYQPVVALDGRVVVGYEALTRPLDGPWRNPIELLEAAASTDTTVAFDWRCRLTAVKVALEAHFPSDLMLFVNAEPVALDAPPPPGSLALLAQAGRMSITVEITERDLMRNPAGLLRAADHARHLGWRIAVDDVGADSSSLALLPLLRPDVIKLDMTLIHGKSSIETASIVAAVTAESERTGALVLAEGIENVAHEDKALDMGATWGQGWLYGTPGALPGVNAPAVRGLPPSVESAVTVRAPAAVTPFGVAGALGAPRSCGQGLYDEMERNLLRAAAASGPSTIVLATCGPEGADSTRAVLDALAPSTAMTAVFDSAPTVNPSAYRKVAIESVDPLASERSVIVVAPFLTAALIGLDRGESADGTRMYDYRLTYDRNVTLDAATILLHRIPARVSG